MKCLAFASLTLLTVQVFTFCWVHKLNRTFQWTVSVMERSNEDSRNDKSSETVLIRSFIDGFIVDSLTFPPVLWFFCIPHIFDSAFFFLHLFSLFLCSQRPPLLSFLQSLTFPSFFSCSQPLGVSLHPSGVSQSCCQISSSAAWLPSHPSTCSITNALSLSPPLSSLHPFIISLCLNFCGSFSDPPLLRYSHLPIIIAPLSVSLLFSDFCWISMKRLNLSTFLPVCQFLPVSMRRQKTGEK